MYSQKKKIISHWFI